jgi:eukaryotic-like serine/threonine-protein kinase
VATEPIGALAHLELGRAYVLAGDMVKAKEAYQDFLTLWKDADPDIPILKQAKAEYARLDSFATAHRLPDGTPPKLTQQRP